MVILGVVALCSGGGSTRCLEIFILAIHCINGCVVAVEVIRHRSLHRNPLMDTEFSEFFFFIEEFLHYKGILLGIFFLLEIQIIWESSYCDF